MNTKAVYTVHENNQDHHFFTYYAGGYSSPFVAARILINIRNELQNKPYIPENICVAGMLTQLTGDTNYREEACGNPLFQQIRDSEAANYLDRNIHGDEIPFHITIDMDREKIFFAFNPLCKDIGLPDMVYLISGESMGVYFAKKAVGHDNPNWQEKESASKAMFKRHAQYLGQKDAPAHEEKIERFDDLIKACEGRVYLGPGEYPASDYEWGIKEVGSIDELIEKFKHGNWSARTGFVLDNLAFIEQLSGGNEWLALKKDAGEWKTFDSFSFYNMLERKGDNYCRNFINSLQKTPWWNLKHPAETINGSERLREVVQMVEERTGGKQQFAVDFTGSVYIRQDDSANTGLHMRKNLDYETDLCRLEFQGYIRRMGIHMSSLGMQTVADEVKHLTGVLAELEQNPVVVTEEEMSQWASEVTAMQVDRAIAESKHELEAATQQEPEIIM